MNKEAKKGSGYDASKDVIIEDLGTVGETALRARIRKYGEAGVQKLVITRAVGTKGKERPVCRLTFAQVSELGPFLDEFTARRGTGEE